MRSECSFNKVKLTVSRIIMLLAACFILFCMTACGNDSEDEPYSVDDQISENSVAEQKNEDTTEHKSMKELKLSINGTGLSVTWEDNESVTALTDLVSETPLTIQMSMYGGFEQVGSIGETIPRNDKQITTSAGDIVLYSGNQIVVFYGSNSWAHTRLGKITDLTDKELEKLLGHGDVVIKIELNE